MLTFFSGLIIGLLCGAVCMAWIAGAMPPDDEDLKA
jgi:hypothetical protein